MKTLLVSGLLGSGKTTFIQNLSRELLHGRTVVLVNDFGSVGIDGEILSSSDLEYIEMPDGCVCCSLRDDLITTLKKIAENFSPEQLIIEPSGIAAPSGILEVLDDMGIHPVSVVVVIDTHEFPELHASEMYGSFFMDQILNADIILLNKTDIASAEQADATLNIAETLNPAAVIIKTVHARLDLELPSGTSKKRINKVHRNHFRFDSVSLRFENRFHISAIRDFFEEMARGRFGSISRAKALVFSLEGCYRIDLSYGKVDAVFFNKPLSDSRLVIIGESIEKNSIESFFKIR